MTSRFALIEHRGHWCVEDTHRHERVEGTCLSMKYRANKKAVERGRDMRNEHWEARNGGGVVEGGNGRGATRRVDAGAR
jgi:hypothetical protein